MKRIRSLCRPVDASRLVTGFGTARLVVNARGEMELRGGTKADQVDAREWISLFMHEAVPKILPR
jgi:hypothetical protein